MNLEWHDSFQCGFPLLDSQHRTVFQRTNELLDLSLSDSSSAELNRFIASFIDEIRKHFHDEDHVLETFGFTGIAQHSLEHAELLARGDELLQHNIDGTLIINDLVHFVVYELIMLHILGSDREYFTFIAENNHVSEPSDVHLPSSPLLSEAIDV